MKKARWQASLSEGGQSMKEMSEQGRQAEDVRSRRRRVTKSIGRIVGLLAATFWLVVFIMVLRTGYLSWIGILVGVACISPGVLLPIAGFAGRRRLAAFLGWLSAGLPMLLALALGLVSVWPEGDTDASWTPYRFADELAAIEARRVVADRDNAAHHYDALFAEVDVNEELNVLFNETSNRVEFERHPWKGGDYPQASAQLDSRTELIDRLLAIGRMEKCRWPVQADWCEYTVPHKGLRCIARLLLTAGNRDLGEDRVTSALAKYFAVLAIADHCGQQPSPLYFCMSAGVEKSALRMIRHALVGSDLSAEDSTDIARRLPPAGDSWPQEWPALLESEKLTYMNFLARAYETDGKGRIRFARRYRLPRNDGKTREDRELGAWSRLYWPMNMPLRPEKVRAMADRHFARYSGLGANRVPPSREQMTSLWGEVPEMIGNFHRWMAETWLFTGEEYVRTYYYHTERMALRRGVWLLFGLRRYRDAHDAWPVTLDAISEYVPREAFSDPTSDEVFVYQREGDSFRLYSKGFNRIDEGGRRGYVRALDKSEDDIWLWPPPAPEPETKPLDEEEMKEMKQELEEIYGREYVETLYEDEGSDER